MRSVNDTPVAGLTVAQVANYFRNVGQTKITLEIVENLQSFASGIESGPGIEQLMKIPRTFPSGKAIAAPGSALAIPKVASSKQSVLGPRAKPAAKALALQPPSREVFSVPAHVPSASGANCTDLPSKSVDKILYLGRQGESIRPDKAEEKATTSKSDIDMTCKGVSSDLKEATLQKADPASVACKGGAKAQVVQAKKPPTTTDPSQAVISVSSPPRATSVQPAKAPSNTEVTSTVAAKHVNTSPRSLPAQANSTTTLILEKAPLQTLKLISPSSSFPKTPTTGTGTDRRTMLSSVDTSNSTAQEMTSTASILVLNSLNASKDETEPVHQPPFDSSVLIAPTPLTRNVPSNQVSSSQAAPTATQSYDTLKRGKKRRRRRKKFATSNGRLSNKGDKTQQIPEVSHEMDAKDGISDSDDAHQDDPLPTECSRKERRCDRSRHSLTIDRLVGMGFTLEDAEASVKAFGDDPDGCMVWIISKIEERQFNEDLNRASIQSEQSKRDEEKRVKLQEREKLASTTKFMAVYPTSYMVCPESSALNLKKFLQSTINQSHTSAHIRDALSKLLTLEGKSIRWYKEAAKPYMLKLAKRLDTELMSHDSLACCAQSGANARDTSCAFERKVVEEVEALTKALYEMPTNQGGVPPVFLECDETTKFNLENDGFEVLGPNEL